MGASLFFGATDQTTVATEVGLNRDSEDFEFQLENDLSFLYGEASDGEGESAVNKRSWKVAGQPGLPRVCLGESLCVRERPVQPGKENPQKVQSGDRGQAHCCWTRRCPTWTWPPRSWWNRRSDPKRMTATEEWLGRWTGAVKFRRSFSGEKAVFEAGWSTTRSSSNWSNFTVEAQSSLAFRLSEVVSLKLSVQDNFDKQAKDRGAASNNDGRVLFSVLAAFEQWRAPQDLPGLS